MAMPTPGPDLLDEEAALERANQAERAEIARLQRNIEEKQRKIEERQKQVAARKRQKFIDEHELKRGQMTDELPEHVLPVIALRSDRSVDFHIIEKIASSSASPTLNEMNYMCTIVAQEILELTQERVKTWASKVVEYRNRPVWDKDTSKPNSSLNSALAQSHKANPNHSLGKTSDSVVTPSRTPLINDTAQKKRAHKAIAPSKLPNREIYIGMGHEPDILIQDDQVKREAYPSEPDGRAVPVTLEEASAHAILPARRGENLSNTSSLGATFGVDRFVRSTDKSSPSEQNNNRDPPDERDHARIRFPPVSYAESDLGDLESDDDIIPLPSKRRRTLRNEPRVELNIRSFLETFSDDVKITGQTRKCISVLLTQIHKGELQTSDLACGACGTTEDLRYDQCWHFACRRCVDAARGSKGNKIREAGLRCLRDGCEVPFRNSYKIADEVVAKLRQNVEESQMVVNEDEEKGSDVGRPDQEEVANDDRVERAFFDI